MSIPPVFEWRKDRNASTVFSVAFKNVGQQQLTILEFKKQNTILKPSAICIKPKALRSLCFDNDSCLVYGGTCEVNARVCVEMAYHFHLSSFSSLLTLLLFFTSIHIHIRAQTLNKRGRRTLPKCHFTTLFK